MKAVQVHVGLEPPYEHRIHVLLDPLQHELDVPPGVVAADELSRYIVETRYPGDMPDATEAEADHAHELAAVVVSWSREVTVGG